MSISADNPKRGQRADEGERDNEKNARDQNRRLSNTKKTKLRTLIRAGVVTRASTSETLKPLEVPNWPSF